MIIVWGANPAWCSVHSMHIIQKAKENGCKVVFIDPVMTASASKADEFIEMFCNKQKWEIVHGT